MAEKQWYETLYENYGQKYDNEVFTKGTLGECDFIEQELNFNKALRLLDVGCGTGRHAIELTQRGYNVVGIDLSETLINRARAKAEAAGLQIEFHQGDARALPFKTEFDAAIMLCEGGFSLMETDEMNFAILENVTRVLKPGSKFIFTALNGLFPLFHSVTEYLSNAAEEGNATQDQHSFDLMTFRDRSVMEIEDDNGKQVQLQCNERYYVPSEIIFMLRSLNYTQIDIFGAKLGAFSRENELRTDDMEMLVIAELCGN
ncbi:class I SAM-dependent methyltransferase [Spirulina sp. CS-785/01]|uniref:class I SAM-dependent methyltransferase n=1 Tax=Spirulina sp. CS-785/01 TaxID=3021716 RepID=UPI003FA7F048